MANRMANGKVSNSDVGKLVKVEEPDLIDIFGLSYATSISKRTIFRLLKDPQFPRIKIGKKLLFEKRRVLQYLNNKFGEITI